MSRNSCLINIDLLLTDVIMPGMNGRELADGFKEINPNLKCMFMSGYTVSGVTHPNILGPEVNFLQKPISNRKLAPGIRESQDS